LPSCSFDGNPRHVKPVSDGGNGCQTATSAHQFADACAVFSLRRQRSRTTSLYGRCRRRAYPGARSCNARRRGDSAQPPTTLDRWMSDDTCRHRGLQARILPAHDGLRQRARERARVITGECRVEGLPPRDPSARSDHRLALEGLRLQLDLRIVPGPAGGEAAAAAVWRIESDRVKTLSLDAPSALQRAAVAAGVAVLVAALGVWFLTSPRTDTRGQTELPPAHAPAPAARASASSRGTSPHPAAPQAPASARLPESLERGVAPRIIAAPGHPNVPPPSAEKAPAVPLEAAAPAGAATDVAAASPSMPKPSGSSHSAASEQTTAAGAAPRAGALPSPVGSVPSVEVGEPARAATVSSAVVPPPASARAGEQRPAPPRASAERANSVGPTAYRASVNTPSSGRPVGDMLELFEDTK
jgi:hypothetical protein